MNVTREVVTDLLPVYFSGEASEDTKVLVEDYFRSDPDFERVARSAATPLEALRAVKPSAPEAEKEKRDLECVRGKLWRRKIMFGLALFFTFVPLAFFYSKGHFVWLVREDPWEAAFFWSLAAILWLFYFARLTRRTVSLLFAMAFTLAPFLLDFHLNFAGGPHFHGKNHFQQLWDAAFFWSVAGLLFIQYFARLRRRTAMLVFAVYLTVFPIPVVWYLVHAGGPHVVNSVAGPAVVLWVMAGCVWWGYFRLRRKPDADTASEC
jgi:hypothetical protein